MFDFLFIYLSLKFAQTLILKVLSKNQQDMETKNSYSHDPLHKRALKNIEMHKQ